MTPLTQAGDNGLDVLIADDSAVMRAMILRTLRLSGVRLREVTEVGDGFTALHALGLARPDLVLLDINMPVMDGEALLDRIRANPALAALPVIIVSTESSSTRIARLRAKGASFVHKPFTPEQLRDTILGLISPAAIHAGPAGAAAPGDDLDF